MRHDSFERLFEDHAQRLFAFLTYRTGDRLLAEDLLADTFERVLRAHRLFDPGKGTEKQWIYSIAVNLVRDHSRHRVVESRATERLALVTPGAAPDANLESIDVRDELNHALDALNEDERAAIALRFGGDLTIREVAGVLKAGESAVEGRIYRGLAKLRDVLR